MTEQERPLKERIWEFTKDISVKVSKKAEKHWKINTLRVEIASIKHRINVKYKELGRFVYESHKSGTLEDDSYKAGSGEIIEELERLESEIAERDRRIEILEEEMEQSGENESPPTENPEAEDTPPPPPTEESKSADEKPKSDG